MQVDYLMNYNYLLSIDKYKYKGNTPEKTMSRLFGYGNGCFYFKGEKSFITEGYHLIVASRDCGDIRFLKSIGVPTSHILACDIDWFSRERAAEYGVIVSPVNTIESATEWAVEKFGNSLATVNVDLCLTADKMAPIVRKICKIVPKTTQILTTFQAARDRGLSWYLWPDITRISRFMGNNFPKRNEDEPATFRYLSHGYLPMLTMVFDRVFRSELEWNECPKNLPKLLDFFDGHQLSYSESQQYWNNIWCEVGESQRRILSSRNKTWSWTSRCERQISQ